MKISEGTLTILKNFSSINPSIKVDAGSSLKTISAMQNLFASAEVEEEFPCEFAIYDLNEFLGAVSLLGTPDFDFQEEKVVIKGEHGERIDYFYAHPNLIVYPKKDFEAPKDIDIQFELAEDDFKRIKKATSVLQVPNLSLVSSGDGELTLVALDKKNETGNQFSISVGKTDVEHPFSLDFLVENMKFLSLDYIVKVAHKGKHWLAEFSAKDADIHYWMSLENTSQWEEENDG